MKIKNFGKILLLSSIVINFEAFATNNNDADFIMPAGLSEDEQMQIALAMSMSAENQIVTDEQRINKTLLDSNINSTSSYSAIIGKSTEEAINIYIDGLKLNPEIANNLKTAIYNEAKKLENDFADLSVAEKAAAIEGTILGFLFKDHSIAVLNAAKTYLENNKNTKIEFNEKLLSSDNLTAFIEDLDASLFRELRKVGYHNVCAIIMNKLAEHYKMDSLTTFINELKSAIAKLPKTSDGMDDADIDFTNKTVIEAINKITMQIRYVCNNNDSGITYDSLVGDLFDAAKLYQDIEDKKKIAAEKAKNIDYSNSDSDSDSDSDDDDEPMASTSTSTSTFQAFSGNARRLG